MRTTSFFLHPEESKDRRLFCFRLPEVNRMRNFLVIRHDTTVNPFSNSRSEYHCGLDNQPRSYVTDYGVDFIYVAKARSRHEYKTGRVEEYRPCHWQRFVYPFKLGMVARMIDIDRAYPQVILKELRRIGFMQAYLRFARDVEKKHGAVGSMSVRYKANMIPNLIKKHFEDYLDTDAKQIEEGKDA